MSAVKKPRWTETEETILRALWPEALWSEIFKALPGRTNTSITSHAMTLGLVREKHSRIFGGWTLEDEEILRKVYPRGTTDEIRAALPHRGWRSIAKRAGILGLRALQRKKPSLVLAPVIERKGVKGKACTECLVWRPLAKFGPSSTCVGRCKSKCTTCEARILRERYPHVLRKARLKYERKNPEKVYLINQANRARKCGAVVEPITSDELRELRAMYGGLCAYCRVRSGDTLDHVLPLSRGGSHSLSNILPACFRCNHSKRDSTVEEWFASDRTYNPRRVDPGE